jgi:Holliday junction resolvase RusA-like endonuclease
MITLEIHHQLFSKARPRVTKTGHAFMPAAYRKNQKELLAKIKEQYNGPPLEGPLRVEIELRGEGRGDIDNIAGALMDTVNKVLWVDDRVSIIPQLEISWQKAKKIDSCWKIKIYMLECQETLL